MRLVHVRNHQKKAKEGGQSLIPIAKSVIDNLITVSVPVGGPYLLRENIVLVEAAFFASTFSVACDVKIQMTRDRRLG